MKLTRQQSLVLFDIAKSAMNHSETGFAGYSKEEIMKLLNEIISQQDNTELLELETNTPKGIDLSSILKPGVLYNVGKVEDPELLKLDTTEGLQDVTHEVLKNIDNSEEPGFWD